MGAYGDSADTAKDTTNHSAQGETGQGSGEGSSVEEGSGGHDGELHCEEVEY